mgnify:CR=1 FL=1
MSKMLEQAIIDAEALKDAALKNAESIILEKYSLEVKEAVDNLLEEQPEEEMATEEAETSEGDKEFMEDMTRADIEDLEEDCGCPEKDTYTVSFDELKAQADAAIAEDQEDHLDVAEDVMQEEQETVEEDEELEEELDITEENLDEIADLLEDLVVDLRPVPSGVPGGGTNNAAEQEIADAAKAEELTAEEELDEDEEKTELEETIKALNTKVEELEVKNSKFEEVVTQLKEHLDDVNLSNAKLLYTNRVLGSPSLNERQKTKIVEALSKTSTVEEAKIIYDTLQSTVGTGSKPGPKSLREAVTRSSSATLSRRKDKTTISNPVSSRWRTLAGIKDNN